MSSASISSVLQTELAIGKAFKSINDQNRELKHETINGILDDESIAVSFKCNAIIWNIMEDNLELEDV